MDIRSTSAYVAQSAAAAPATPATTSASKTAPTQPADAVKASTPEPSAEHVSQALKDMNSALQARSQNLQFSVDKDSARTVVTLTDTSTNEVILQMPTKEALEISKALEHLQGLLIKQTA